MGLWWHCHLGEHWDRACEQLGDRRVGLCPGPLPLAALPSHWAQWDQ